MDSQHSNVFSKQGNQTNIFAKLLFDGFFCQAYKCMVRRIASVKVFIYNQLNGHPCSNFSVVPLMPEGKQRPTSWQAVAITKNLHRDQVFSVICIYFCCHIISQVVLGLGILKWYGILLEVT
eukprot:TRINITY_DN35168_c0_g2_i1.p2 TRINITY_DN35168_c0_g2~~TRINITY_DN35168_c0_g2_i1.p2  ORF type:complete len:122 (-),score=15.35 TRINITY_DN35168_c0_g2_i1:275-640(-)